MQLKDLRDPARLAHLGMNTLPAGVRYRVRNCIALGRWMIGATGAPYDDTFWNLQAEADWPAFARCILDHAAGTSVIDVGCGEGRLLSAIRDARPGVRLRGVDGSGAGLRRAAERGLPVEAMDLAMWRQADANRLRGFVDGHDVAICLETAEHLPPWSAAHLARALSAAPVVVFSAAHPDQGGTLHMNEKPFEYWERLFAGQGLTRSRGDEAFRAAVAALRVPYWYAANIHVLTRA